MNPEKQRQTGSAYKLIIIIAGVIALAWLWRAQVAPRLAALRVVPLPINGSKIVLAAGARLIPQVITANGFCVG